MICLKSPKSSKFAFFNKQLSKIHNYVDFIISLTIIQLIFKYREIKKIVKPPVGFEPTAPGF